MKAKVPIEQSKCPMCGEYLWPHLTGDHKYSLQVVYDFNCPCGFKVSSVFMLKFSHFINKHGELIV